MPQKNVHQNFYFLLPAKNDTVCRKTQKLLLAVPAEKKIDQQEDTSGASSNSQKTKPLSSR
jgi:hypothetical protein